MTRNRLADETSPYLLQHADNPVHWHPWGEDALAEARANDKPILLSVGYAACHWCHVMAHESFEDDATAAVMNELFVNIKVDREERPDVDRIYMAALHHLGEHGGWPLTMFLTPDGEPFWGGTYFPKQAQYGRPAFVEVLKAVARVYHEDRDKVETNRRALVAALNAVRPPGAAGALTPALLDRAAAQLLAATDPLNGGLQGAPKFPQTMLVTLLWRAWLRTGDARYANAVTTTLIHISQGGIYDHLGGGYARYAVDARWLVPHFEKMLYDNALLIELLAEAWRVTGQPLFRLRIEETVAWIVREMRAPDGGFAASLDADSEGEEGRYYVWSAGEVDAVLGAEAEDFKRVYDVTPEGNWEGHTILNRLGALALGDDSRERRLATQREILVAHRQQRERPGWDDKVLADWNGLAIAALARAAMLLDRPDWLALAADGFRFVNESLTVDGRLRHAYRLGRAAHEATADDYANLIRAALTLHTASADDQLLAQAQDWLATLDAEYWDAAHGGYFFTSERAGDLIARTRTGADDATPNANATMVENLAGLYLRTGDGAHLQRADAILEAFAADITANPLAHAGLLNAFEVRAALPHAILIGAQGDPATEALRRAALRQFPAQVTLTLYDDAPSLPDAHPVAGKTALDGRPTLYYCADGACSPPVTDPNRIAEALPAHRPSHATGSTG